MVWRLLMTLSLSAGLCMTVACDRKVQKTPIKKDGKRGEQGDQVFQKLIRENTKCLDLKQITDHLRAKKDDIFAAYTADVDFGRIEKSPSNRGIEFNSAENGELRAMITFFSNSAPNLETGTGEDLISLVSTQGLLNVRIQKDCESVTFATTEDDPHPQVFNVMGTTPNLITLVNPNTNEYRTYSVSSNDELVITRFVRDIFEVCGRHIPSGHIKKTLAIAWGNALNRVKLNRRFAKDVLAAHLHEPAELAAQLNGAQAATGPTPGQGKRVANGGPRDNVSSDSVSISYIAYKFIVGLIFQGMKDGKVENLTCQ